MVRAWVILSGSTHALTDRKSTRLNSSHVAISYAVFCLKTKTAAGHLRFARRKNSSPLRSSLSASINSLPDHVHSSQHFLHRIHRGIEFFFILQAHGNHRDLHSFPTRRSSD